MFLSSPINFIVSRPVSELSGGSILSMPCTNMWEVSSIPCVDGGKYNIPCTSIPVGADSTCRFDISAMAHIPHGTIVSISDGKDVVFILFITELTSDNCVAINDDNNIFPSQFCRVRLLLHGRGVKFSIFSISSRVGSMCVVVDLGVEARRERDEVAAT